MLNVFKFGGTSIKDATSIQNIAQIITNNRENPLLIVVSASGKTTNALEDVLHAYIQQNGQAENLLQKVKENHYHIIEQLFQKNDCTELLEEINDLFVDIEWILEEDPEDTYGYLYDQIVSTGELLSSKIVAFYLECLHVSTHWLDARDCIFTDNNYRSANIIWEETQSRIQQQLPSLLENNIVVTQGFIGSSTENFNTTLGREGSDYSAAIFAHCLNAKQVSIWKDVEGVLNADPKLFSFAKKIDVLSYADAIEMSYYGAQVIHPKTLRPLQQKEIPLYVKSFINPKEEGTLIHSTSVSDIEDIVIVKKNLHLLTLDVLDYQFIDEYFLAKIYQCFAKLNIRVQLSKHTALHYQACLEANKEQCIKLLGALESDYKVGISTVSAFITTKNLKASLENDILSKKHIMLKEEIDSIHKFAVVSWEEISVK